MRRIIPACLLTAIIGVILGYLGAYVEYANERDHGANCIEWKQEWLGIPAIPGMLIASSFRGYDYAQSTAGIVQWIRR